MGAGRSIGGFVLAALAGLLIAAPSPPAFAQAGAQCQRLRAELASLDRAARAGQGGVGAQKLRSDLATASAQYRGMGCEPRGFLVFSQPPAQCGPLRARIGQLQAAVAQVGGGANPAIESRRRQLLAAWQAQCDPRGPAVAAAPPPPRGGLFDALFGPRPPAVFAPPPAALPLPRTIQIDPEPFDPDAPIDPDDETRLRRFGGGKPVCVRTCDGFFFPLANSPGGRGAADDMCQALCPAATTRLFFMPGDSDIERATRPDGEAYADLPNALKFRKAVDASCSCRKPGQSWREVLAEAESLLSAGKNDVVVTEEKSEELSRPALRGANDPPQTPDPRPPRPKGRAPPAAAIPATPAPDDGIPAAPPAITVAPLGTGEARVVPGDDEERRRIRIVGPKLPAPR